MVRNCEGTLSVALHASLAQDRRTGVQPDTLSDNAEGRSSFVQGRLVIQSGNGVSVTLPAMAGLG